MRMQIEMWTRTTKVTKKALLVLRTGKLKKGYKINTKAGQCENDTYRQESLHTGKVSP